MSPGNASLSNNAPAKPAATTGDPLKPAGQSLQFLTHVQRDREVENELEKRPLDWGLARRLYQYTKPHAHMRNMLLLIVTVRSALVPALVAINARIIGGPIANGKMDQLFWGVGIYVVAVALHEFLAFWRFYFGMKFGEAVVHDIRNDIFEHIHSLPMSFYNKTKLGRVLSRITSDVDSVRGGVQEVPFVGIIATGRILFAGLMMLWIDPQLFLIVAVAGPVLYGIYMIFRNKLTKAHRAVQESYSRVTSTLAESVSGIRVTQGFVRQDMNARMFRDLIEDHSEYNMNVSRIAGRFQPLLEMNSQVFIALLMVIGGYQVLHGDPEKHGLQTLISFFLLAPEFFGPIPDLGNQYSQALVAMAGAERVFKLLDTKPEFSDPPTALDFPLRGKVEFRQVSFGYDPANLVLRDVNFTAQPGQTIALVGHTGSGKSSIINLISKFYLPTSGMLLLDGVDIREVQSDSLHRQMGIVLQVNYLFTGTVMENIRVGKDGSTDEQVREAARKLDCLDLLEALPDGLMTQVGERGASLSLGQRQLACFCRAMLADPRILILDEATSSVDGMTESRIQKSLAILLRDRTSFVVAHRLSTIRHADLVLVLDHGRIVERGKHKQLLATGGVYANLYRKFIRASEA